MLEHCHLQVACKPHFPLTWKSIMDVPSTGQLQKGGSLSYLGMGNRIWLCQLCNKLLLNSQNSGPMFWTLAPEKLITFYLTFQYL